MKWIEVKAVFETAPPDWSIFVEIFDRHGCENTLQTDTPPTLGSAVVDVKGSGEVIAALTQDLLAAGATTVESRSLVEENWEENWKKFFHPREVGTSWLIRPTWEEATSPNRHVIVLDPGQAFGTGDHPTTRMCLELLERVPLSGKRVADVGCGSGILSIGACMSGAATVHAVDIEPLAVEVAKENSQINKVHFEAIAGNGVEALEDDGPFDLVMSNIISATLIQIAPEVADVVSPGGFWIVSGIILQNWDDVQAAAEANGFRLREKLEEDGWVGATFVRS